MQYTESVAGEYAKYRGVVPELLKRLMAGSGIASTSHVLEIGCGTGNYLHAVSMTSGCCSTGVDPSDDMLCSGALAGPARLLRGCGETLPLADAMFDFGYSVDVIHHVVNREDFYSEAARVLRPGGWLVYRHRFRMDNPQPRCPLELLSRHHHRRPATLLKHSTNPSLDDAGRISGDLRRANRMAIQFKKQLIATATKPFPVSILSQRRHSLSVWHALRWTLSVNPESFVEMVRYDLVWGTKGGEM